MCDYNFISMSGYLVCDNEAQPEPLPRQIICKTLESLIMVVLLSASQTHSLSVANAILSSLQSMKSGFSFLAISDTKSQTLQLLFVLIWKIFIYFYGTLYYQSCSSTSQAAHFVFLCTSTKSADWSGLLQFTGKMACIPASKTFGFFLLLVTWQLAYQIWILPIVWS